MPKEKPLMSVRAFARDYGVGLTQAYIAVHKGEIPAIRIGKRLWIVRGALEKKLRESARTTATHQSVFRQSSTPASD